MRLIFTILAVLSFQLASTQSDNFILSKLDDKAEDLDNLGYTIMRLETCNILKTNDEDTGTYYVFRQLQSGKEYEIRAFPHTGEVENIKLRLYRKIQLEDGVDWQLEIQDVGATAEARINFSPPVGLVDYRIEIHASGFKGNHERGRFGFIVGMK